VAIVYVERGVTHDSNLTPELACRTDGVSVTC
jgi:hypothetical protein